jgi:GTP cyclohydrolase I
MAQNLALDPAESPPPGRPRAALRIASEGAPVDLAAAERAAADFLAALGISLDREGLRETPARMARAYAELLAPRPFHLTTFPNDEGYDELVLARAIPFRPSASTTYCRSPGSRTSATCPPTASSGCPSWPG